MVWQQTSALILVFCGSISNIVKQWSNIKGKILMSTVPIYGQDKSDGVHNCTTQAKSHT
jgi:hypothetical protein